MHHILKNTDWEVIGIDSFQHKGIVERVTEMMENHIENWSRLSILTHDLTKPIPAGMRRKIGKIDYIINLASLSDVQDSIDDPEPFVMNNVQLMMNMLQYAREAKPEVFIQFSTDEVYGASEKDQAHPEWSPIVPSNPYSASKAMQEDMAIAWWRSFGVPMIITNTMNNFSEYQQPSKYPVIVQRALMNREKLTVHGTKGEMGTRYYIHSRNAADAVLFILKNCPPYQHKPGFADKPDRYNIVGDKQVDNLSLAQTIAKLMGKELEYELVDFHSTRPGHDLHYGLDGTKLRKKGWKSPLSFEESLKNTIEWQMNNQHWIT
jgi:dTDP-glucose 4,6-dehydratase